MPRNPISRLMGRERPQPAPLRKDVEQALTQLAQLAEERPELAELAAVQAALLRAAFDPAALAGMPTPELTTTPDHAATKLAAGIPLLRGEPLALDGPWLKRQALALCAAIVGRGAETAPARSAAALQAAIQQGNVDVHALALDVVAGDPRAVVERAAQLELDAGFAATILRWTLLPLMEQVARAAEPLRELVPWQRGYCPTCGAWPMLAEQRGIEQSRFLRCGLCVTSWQIGRTQCPFCDSQTPGDLGYLYEERSAGTQRAVTCERCHHYYKAVAALSALTPPLLAVMDLRTLHLDLIALERAYLAPT